MDAGDVKSTLTFNSFVTIHRLSTDVLELL